MSNNHHDLDFCPVFNCPGCSIQYFADLNAALTLLLSTNDVPQLRSIRNSIDSRITRLLTPVQKNKEALLKIAPKPEALTIKADF